MRGEGGVAGSQPMSTAVHISPNKLNRSNFIINLWQPPTREQEHVASVEKVGHILHADVAAVRVHEQDHVPEH
jgi:hypothetical protein